MRHVLVLSISLGIVLIASCGSNGSEPPPNTAPTVVILSPAVNVQVTRGDALAIRFRDNDPDDDATTDVFADRDGDLATTDDQFIVATGRTDANDAESSVSWVTSGIALGSYRIVVRVSDGVNAPTLATAVGLVELVRIPPAFIVFPTANARTDATMITVVGQTRDGADVAAVRVNGQAATSSDGFATWRATVPLTKGPNDLALEVEDAAGGIDREFDALRVNAALSMVGPADVALLGDVLAILDTQSKTLLTLSLGTRALEVAARGDVGSGPPFASPVGLAPDAAGGRVFVLDTRELLSVDLLSGDRTPISGDMAGGLGLPFSVPRVVAYPGVGNNVYVLDAALLTLFGVDLDSGDRVPWSSPDRGAGELVTQPRGAAVTPDETIVYALSASPATVYAIDVATGVRTVVSNDLTGFGPRLGFGEDLCADFAGQRAFVLNTADGSLLEVELGDGDRTEISNRFSEGPSLTTAAGIAFDPSRTQVLVADPVLDAIVAVSVPTGTRTVLVDSGAGSGPLATGANVLALDMTTGETFLTGLSMPGFVAVDRATGARRAAGTETGVQALAFDPEAQRLVGGTSAGSLVALDPNTGERTTLSGPGVGSGPPLGSITAVSLDASAQAAYVFDVVLDAILHIDLVSGDRIIVSSDAIGNGPPLRSVFGLARDATTLYVAEDALDAILAVDLETGVRTMVSDANSPGVALATLRSMVLSTDRQRLFIADQVRGAIVAVTLATGARVDLSGQDIGRGTPLSGPEGLAFDTERGLLATFDVRLGGVVLIDPVTGDRVVQSR